MTEEPKVVWTKPKREKLRKVVKEAEEKKVETFYFEGHEYYTPYAKYLVEYLDTALGR